jgi:hypothetical protein
MLTHSSLIASQDHQRQMTAAPATTHAAHEQATHENIPAQTKVQLDFEQREQKCTKQQPADTTDVYNTTAASYGRTLLDVHATADLM